MTRNHKIEETLFKILRGEMGRAGQCTKSTILVTGLQICQPAKSYSQPGYQQPARETTASQPYDSK